MRLSKKLLMVPLLFLPLVSNYVPEKNLGKTERKEKNIIKFASTKKHPSINIKNNLKHSLDSTLTDKEIKQKQEEYFERFFKTDLGKINYLRRDLPARYEMIIKGEDSIHIDKTVNLWKRRNVLLHEYAHIKQRDIRSELKKIGVYNNQYDDTSNNIYSTLITEGSAEAAQYIALKKEPPKKHNFVALCRERDAGMNRLRKAGEFYNTGANFIYPLMEKIGLKRTIIGLYTTPPPTSSDFWNEEKRKEYMQKVEKNSEKYSPIILEK